MIKISSEELLKIILEQMQELEPISMENATTATRLSRVSVDDQVDSQIMEFERQSIFNKPLEDIAEALGTLSLKTLILEQIDDEDLEDAGEEAPDDDAEADVSTEPEASEPGGSEEVTAKEPAEIQKPKINMNEFAKRVARLAMDHDSLLDIPTVIVNRSLNYLKNNYDDVHVQKMIEILNNDFDFNLGKKPEAPGRVPALGAYGGGEGLGMGGGGSIGGEGE